MFEAAPPPGLRTIPGKLDPHRRRITRADKQQHPQWSRFGSYLRSTLFAGRREVEPDRRESQIHRYVVIRREIPGRLPTKRAALEGFAPDRDLLRSQGYAPVTGLLNQELRD